MSIKLAPDYVVGHLSSVDIIVGESRLSCYGINVVSVRRSVPVKSGVIDVADIRLFGVLQHFFRVGGEIRVVIYNIQVAATLLIGTWIKLLLKRNSDVGIDGLCDFCFVVHTRLNCLSKYSVVVALQLRVSHTVSGGQVSRKTCCL